VSRVEELLERMANALDKMSNDPEIEIEGGPPICANCGRMNPIVDLSPQPGGRGPLAEIAIEATCTHCGSLTIAIPESYSVHKSRESALKELREKVASFGQDIRSLQGE
jgi:hypothetical protein